MNKEQVIYSVLEQDLSLEAENALSELLDLSGLTSTELALFNMGLRAYQCPVSGFSTYSLNEIEALLSKLKAIDQRLALVVGTGLSVSMAMGFRYQSAREILKRVDLDDLEVSLGALSTIVICFRDFLDTKVRWDLPRYKVAKCLEHFELASNTLRERGQLRASVYIGLVGLRMAKRILPSLKLDWMLGQLKTDCAYYGWADLGAFLEAEAGSGSLELALVALREEGALEEWLYGLEKAALEAYSSGDTQAAAAHYKTVADYLLHGL